MQNDSRRISSLFNGSVSGQQRLKRRRNMLLAAAASVLSTVGSANAGTNGTWTNTTTGGLWGTTTNWNSGTVATGQDGIADFSTLELTADNTVHLDSARTIGGLVFGDITPTNNWILDNNSTAGNILTLSTSSATPTITVNNQTATISAVLAGTQGFTMTGPGALVLSGVNTYTGTTTINSGTVSISGNNGIGASADALTINGGTLKTTAAITNTHAITIGASGGTIDVTTTGQYYLNTTNALLGSGALTLAGNGTLTANTGNLRIDHTNTFSGPVTLNSGGILEYGIAGAVAGGSTFTLGNQGELAVNTGVTLPNNITVSGGTNSVLSFENGTTGIASGTIALNANLTVGLRNWYNYATVLGGTISGVISGTGFGLTVNSGTGTGGILTLTGANTYTGSTTVTKSTLQANDGVGLPTASFLSLDGSVLQGNGVASFTRSLGTTGTAFQLTANGGGFSANGGQLTVNIGGAAAQQTWGTTVGTNIVGALQFGTSTANNVTVFQNGIDLNAANRTINVVAGTGGDSAQISGNIVNSSGTAGLVIGSGGLGTLVLSGTNTYNGTTTLTSGTLSVGSTSNLGAASNTLAFNGGTFQVTGTTMTNFGSHVVTLGTTPSLDINNAANSFAIGQTTLSTQTLTKLGAGTLTLQTGANALKLLQINNGTVDIGSGNLTISDTGGTTINNASTTNSVTINATGGGKIVLTQNSNTDGPDIGAANGGTLTINARITGTSSFESWTGTNNGTGVTVLNGANDYTGDTLIHGGVLSVSSVGNQGSTTSNLGQGTTIHFGTGTVSTGTLLYTGTGETSNRVIDLQGTTAGGIIDQSGTGNLKFTSNLTTTGAGAKTFTLQGSTAGTGEFAGNIINSSGATAVTKAGTGAWTLSGTNTYTGLTTISAGTLIVSGDSHAATGGYSVTGTLDVNNNLALGTGNVTFNTGGIVDSTVSGIVNTAVTPFTWGTSWSFGGTNNLNLGTGAVTASNAANTITLNGTSKTLTFGGTVTNTSNAVQTITANGAGNTLSIGAYALSNNATSRIDVISGSGNVTIPGAVTNGGTATASGLTYSGSGTLTLAGTNTYAGQTTVSAGTLNYSGSLASGAQINIGVAGGSNAVMNVLPGASITMNPSGNNNIVVGAGTTTTTGQGFLYQSGGAIVGSTGGTSPYTALTIGAGASGSSYGYYSLSAGTASVSEFDVGGFNAAATGVFDMSGGTLTVSTWLIASRSTGSGIGILNQTGGTINYTGVAGQFQNNWGTNGTAVINVGGTLTAANADLNLNEDNNSTNFGEINLLTGGTLQVHSIASSTLGTKLLSFNGGTLKASTANTTFLPTSLTGAFVFGSGGTIDNNGVAITIPVALQAPTGNGVTATGVTVTGGTGYLGAPAVTFSGGGGTGAAGYVTVSGGTITGLVITNPGTGYTSTPTVLLTGGGSTSGSITLAAPVANTSGGITFAGVGTTSLTAASTYTGATTINAGSTLQLGSAGTTGGLASAGTITDNGIFTINRTNAVVQGTDFSSSGISGTGVFNQIGSGTTTLNAGNTYSGGTNVTTGTLKFAKANAMSPSGTVAVSSGATLAVNAGGTGEFTDGSGTATTGTIGGVLGAGAAVTFASGSTFAVDTTNATAPVVYSTNIAAAGLTLAKIGSGTFNYSGNISSTTAVNAGGSGTLVLSGSNTYTGATTISAGTLEYQANTAMSSGSALSISTGGTLSLKADANTTFTPFSTTGAAGGAYTIAVNQLTGAGTGKTLTLANGFTIGTANSGNNLTVSSTSGDTLLLSSQLALANSGNGASSTITLSGANMTLNAGVSYNGNANGPTLNVNAGSNTLTINGNWTTGNNRWSGIVINNGTVTMTNGLNGGSSTNNGVYAVLNGGTLNLNSTFPIGGANAGNNFSISGGTLDNTSGSAKTLGINMATFFNGDFAFSTAGGTSANNLTLNGGATLNGAAGARTITTNGSATLTLGGVIVNGSATGLTKAGTGTLALTGNNTFSNTTVNAGTLSITGGYIQGTSLTIASGATLTTSVNNSLSGGSATAPTGAWTIAGTLTGTNNAQTLSTNVTLNNGTMSGNTFAGFGTFLAASAGTLTANGASNTINAGNFGLVATETFSTPLSSDALSISSVLGATSASAGGIVKTGAGTLTLSAANTYTGGTTLNGGTTQINSAASLGATSGSVTINAATLETTANISSSRSVVLGDVASSIKVDPSTTYTLSSPVTGTGTLNLTGTGTLDLTAANTYSGNTNVNAGTLTVDTTGSIASTNVAVAASATMNVLAGGSISSSTNLANNGIVNLNNPTRTIATLNGSGALNLNSTALTVSNGGSYSGVIANGASAGSLTLSGGSLTLSGASTYSGGTTVSAGTLLATNTSGSATGSAAVTIASGATLGGTGILSGPVTVNGTIFAGLTNNTAGKIAAVLNIGSGSTLAGSTLLDLTATNASDEITFNGGAGLANLGGTLTVTNPNAITFASGQSYDLFGFGSEAGTFSSAPTLPTLPSTLAWNTSQLYSNGIISIGSNGPVVSQWAASIGGSWNTSSNWSNGIPTGQGAQANMLSAPGLTAPASVTLDGNQTIGRLTFNNSSAYSIDQGTGSGTLTLDDTNGISGVNPSITVSSGNHAITAPMSLAAGVSVNVASGSALNLAGNIAGTGSLIASGSGTVTLAGANTYSGNTTVNAGTMNLTGSITSANVTVASGATLNASGAVNNGLASSANVIANGTVAFAGAPLVTGPNPITVAAINVGSLGQVNVTDPGTATGNHANRTVLLTSSLSLPGTTDSWSGQVDLAGNDLIVHGGSVNDITNQIKSGYNNGSFNGSGITSTAALNDPNTLSTLGVLLNNDGSGNTLYDSFDNQSVTAADVLVKYTYYGDANLDGTVNSSDYSQIDNGFNSGLSGWYNGDFNYDGVVNSSDYSLIDNAFNQTQGLSLSSASAAGLMASSTALIAPASSAAVPEPSSLCLLGLAAAGLMGRRRRRQMSVTSK